MRRSARSAGRPRGAAPRRFFSPPYVGYRGWLGVRLDVPVDWDEIAGLVADAYHMVAPRPLLARLDALAGTRAGRPVRLEGEGP